jgi:hypothetical protein
MLVNVIVNTSSFEFSHGNKPRGRGNWAFFIGDATVPWFAPVNCLYKDAKATAVRRAKRQCVNAVTVGA